MTEEKPGLREENIALLADATHKDRALAAAILDPYGADDSGRNDDYEVSLIVAYRQQIERGAREKEAGLWRAHICLSGLKVEAADMETSIEAEHEIRKARLAERDRVRQKGILEGEEQERRRWLR